MIIKNKGDNMNISEKTYEERRKGSISPEIAKLLVEQISHELYNHNLYRTFANYFAVKGLPDLEEYYIKRAEEEIDHHRWIANRLNYADVEFIYPAIPNVETVIEDEVSTFAQTLDKEIETTELIYNIVNVAKEEGDWETVYWLEKGLVDEQTEEEHISRLFLKIAKQDTDWVTKGKHILETYLGGDDDENEDEDESEE
jgi:ferritin